MKKNAEMKFRHFLSVLEENNVNIVNPQVSLIMPALKFDELSHAAYPDIMIEQGKLELSLWNKEINLTGALAKGKITAAVTSDAWSDTGNIRPPRSVLTGQPYSSRKEIIA